MSRIANIGPHLKKCYRVYIQSLQAKLLARGFTDLRPSFLEVLLALCEEGAMTIKDLGHSCGLKKQTMTGHLNELEKREYIKRVSSEKDKREIYIHLTEYGERFKVCLIEELDFLEKDFTHVVGDVEMDRIEQMLKNFHTKIVGKFLQK